MLKIFAVRVNSLVIRGILFILEMCIHCRDLDEVMLNQNKSFAIEINLLSFI